MMQQYAPSSNQLGFMTAQGFVPLNVGNMVAQTSGLSSMFSNRINNPLPLGMPKMHGNPWSFPTSFPFMQQMHSEMMQSQQPTREADMQVARCMLASQLLGIRMLSKNF